MWSGSGNWRIIFTGILFLLPAFGFSQTSNESHFQILTADDGLSQGKITDLLQDRKGFLWMTTLDGLNRYDGHEFKVYHPDPNNDQSLTTNLLSCLLEDSKEGLWIGGQQGGLEYFDPATETFYHFLDDPNAPINLVDVKVKQIVEDKKGDLWVGTEVNGLLYLKRSPHPEKPGFKLQGRWCKTQSGGLGPTKISGLYYSPDSTLWVIGDQKLWALESSKEGKELQLESKKGPIWSLCPLPNGMLLLGGEGEIGLLNPETRKIKTIFSEADENGYPIFIREVDRENRIWIDWRGHGSGIIEWEDVLKGKKGYQKLFAKQKRFYEDREGLIWGYGTYSGLIKIDPFHDRFGVLLGTFLKKLEIPTGSVSSDPAGRLIVNHKFMDRKTGQGTPFPSEIVFENKTKCILMGPEGNIWINLSDGELWKIAAGTEAASLVYTFPEKYNGSIFSYCDQKGKLWGIKAQQGELVSFDPEGLEMRSYKIPGPIRRNRLMGGFLNHAIETTEGKMWLATHDGIFQFDPQAETFRHINSQSQPKGSRFSSDFISALCQDVKYPEQILWLGTRGGGLNRLDLTTGQVSVFGVEEGLGNGTIYGLLSDEKGRLWMSTNQGISCFDPAREEFRNFDVNDGLQGNEFNKRAFFKASDGEMFFGGVKGLNAFYPSQITRNPVPPSIMITGVKLDNQQVRVGDNTAILTRQAAYTDQIELDYGQDMISFEFSSSSFRNPARNTYAYRLEGMHSEWTQAGNDRIATYTNIDPGEYTFRVKGANNDGVWNSKGATLKVIVHPPWWQTWWAYMFYTGIILGVVLIGFRIQRNRLRLQNRLYLEQQEADRLLETNQMRSRFFSNIVHEFRTPLALILGPTDQLLSASTDARKSQKYKLIRNNGLRLLNLINQLLDLSKLEANAMAATYRSRSLPKFFSGVVSGFGPLADRHQVSLDLEGAREEAEVLIDPEKLEKIMFNLISNGLKFNRPGGKLKVEWRLAQEGSDEVLRVEVTDDGKGISQTNLDKIFDRFYQVDDSTTRQGEGTGIGLALSRELAELMGGRLLVQSELGIGTSFILEVPIPKGAGEALDQESPMQTPDSLFTLKPIHPIVIDDKDEVGPKPETNESEIVLIVEDNAEMRLFIRESVGENYQVIEASNGQEGWEKALEWVPDLIISDVMMPLKDGYELCAELKKNEATCHIPIILLTAKAGLGNRLQGLEEGADAYLEKPFSPRELELRIQNLIQVRKVLQNQFRKGEESPSQLKGFRSQDQKFLSSCRKAILTELDNSEFNVGHLCEASAMSRTHLHRKLKALTGLATTAYIRFVRLEQAYRMLSEGQGNIQEICFAVGFSSPSYFSKCFKNQFGKLPKEVWEESSSSQLE